MSKPRKHVVVYTDGAAEPNPGPGGYGAVLMHAGRTRELSGMFGLTTNNRMELKAAVVALEALKESCRVTLHSDSKYLVDAMMDGRAARWRVSGWRRGKKETVANHDLWERLLALCERHDVTFVWVRGHAGDTHNERCDELSMQFLGKRDLPVDDGYVERPEGERELRIKITQAGQPCRKCATPVEKRVPHGKRKPGQAYYYDYYLVCPSCGTMYMVEEAKRYTV
ncbi:MAG: ribonuclease HI [Chloroflexi bacterium]|nr:ribonuclease HI [Chloroflexota bacterium]